MPLQNAKPLRRVRRNERRPAPGAGRPEALEQRRARIARMTAPLFLKKGYDNVSIDEIIGVVGGSKATIYAWFGGKEGLFEAVVRQECRDVVLAIHVDTAGSLEAQLTELKGRHTCRVRGVIDQRPALEVGEGVIVGLIFLQRQPNQ